MHTPTGAGCSCRRPDCASPGKHPRVRWQGGADGAARADEVRSWWRRWPDANVGIVTGKASGVVVLDVDPRAGGSRSLSELETRWGALPATVETLTGGGGRHLWFALDGDAPPSARPAPGLEVKAEGGLVVVPPSLHASGRPYLWAPDRAPWERTPASVPAWLEAFAAGADGPDGVVHPLRDTPARTGDERAVFAEAWRRAGVALRPGDRYYLCAFHAEDHPSLHIDAEGCRWFCFGCRRGGGISALLHELGEPTPGRDRRRLVRRLGEGVAVTLPGDREIDVVGESRHQDELLALTGGERRYGGVDVEVVATLIPEPENAFDPGAIAVTMDGCPVGYLRRHDAARLAPLVHAAGRREGAATCLARIRGGWDRGRGDVGGFGVVLMLPAPPP